MMISDLLLGGHEVDASSSSSSLETYMAGIPNSAVKLLNVLYPKMVKQILMLLLLRSTYLEVCFPSLSRQSKLMSVAEMVHLA